MFANVFRVIRQSSPLGLAIWAVVALTAFVGPLDYSSGGQAMTVGLDAKVVCKLLVSAMAAALGLWGIATSPSVRQTLMMLPPMAVIGILVLVILATPIAISGASLPTAMINLGYVFFLVTALLTLHIRGMATAILAGICVTMTVAWTLFLFLPDYGVFPELLADGLIVKRLGGTAHPNGVGRAVVCGLLLTLYLHRGRTLPAQVAYPLAACFALTAYMAYSRTAMVAGCFGLTMLYLDRLTSRLGWVALTLAGLLGVGSLVGLFIGGQEERFVGKVMSKLSKSGDAEEITSGTGRSQIWGRSIHYIAQRPVIGHGFNSAPTLLIDHSQSTHNAVLYASMIAGLGGGVLMLGLLVYNTVLVFVCDSLLVRALLSFLVISSLTEDTFLETFPGPCTMLWLMCCFYPVLIRCPVRRSAPVDSDSRHDDALWAGST